MFSISFSLSLIYSLTHSLSHNNTHAHTLSHTLSQGPAVASTVGHSGLDPFVQKPDVVGRQRG